MTVINAARVSNRRSGTYVAIFASTYVSLFLCALIAEQLGVARGALEKSMAVAPMFLFVGIGLFLAAEDSHDFYAASRRTAPYYSGLSLALTAIGGTGVVCITGALFKIGIDALVLLIGWVTGLVFAGVLIFPFVRKCGAYTIPSFLGLRFDSRVVRISSAAVLVVPTLLIVAAELRVGAFLLGWMTGQPEVLMIGLAAVLATAMVAVGGMRSLTWTSATQAIAALLAMVVPATIVSLLISNLPFPQMMHGNLLRAFSRSEFAQSFPPLSSGAAIFRLPGAALEPFDGPYLQSFGHVGPLSLPLIVLVIATGIAGLPALLNRAGTATTVYEARKSMGWAVLNAAFILMTLASVAGFMRGYVSEQIVNAAGDRLPLWFQSLQQHGLAAVGKTREAISLSGIQIKRDVAFVALPMAAGMPVALITLALCGALSAALAGASAHILALGGMIAEDLINGGRREAPEDARRLLAGRLAVGLSGGLGLAVACFVTDPLAVVVLALAFSAATGFPVLVLSILWRKVSRLGAVAGMMTGAGVTVVLMFAASTGVINMSPVLAAVFGGPANFLVMVALSQASPMTARRALEVVRDIRIPGGEAIYDREMRLLRRKRASAVR